MSAEKVPCGYKGCRWGYYMLSNDRTSYGFAVERVEAHRKEVHGLKDGKLPKTEKSFEDLLSAMFGRGL